MNPRTRTAARSLALGVTLSTVAVATSAVPAAASAATGCPKGYQTMAVAGLAPQGYRVPGQMDVLGSFGQAGNRDGLVCAVALGNQTTTWGGQLYNFMDNSLP
jgi:hypothetical protein